MKKLLALLLMLLPVQAFAWEATVGVGYDHRHFSSDDQLGATSPTTSLHPLSSNGLRLSGSWLWDPSKHTEVGAEISLGYGWLSVPYQSSYFTKTAGKIDTSNLTVQSVILVGKFRVLDWKDHLLFLKPGFLITNLSNRWDSVDTDTGGVLSLEVASKLGERNRLTVDVQAILSPTIRGRNEYDFSLGLVFGVQQLFVSEPDVEVPKPVKVPEPVKLPEPVTPVVIPQPVTPTTPVIQPQEQKQETRKTILKLGSDGKLSPESYPMIQKILAAYKKPATIMIQHRKDEKTLAEEIGSWLVSNGCDKEDVVVEMVEKLDKPLRINIFPK
jgi:hypothetical protein